jgi:integrase
LLAVVPETPAGDRISPHVLRHTAKLRRQTGATIEQVASLLGHTSIATTAVYLRQLESSPMTARPGGGCTRDDWPASSDDALTE